MGNKAARDFKKIGHGFESAFNTVIVKPAKGIYHVGEKIEHTIEHAGERVIGDVYGGIKTGIGTAFHGIEHGVTDVRDVIAGVTNRAGKVGDTGIKFLEDIEKLGPLLLGAGALVVVVVLLKK